MTPTPADAAHDAQLLGRLARSTGAEAADHCFSRTLYIDDEIFTAETVLLRKQWLFACHLTDIPDGGSRETTMFGESLILTRVGGSVRAFFNLCRHRGSRILSEDEARAAASLACPYHGWTYDLGGELTKAPSCRTPALPLAPAGCLVKVGMVFVSLAGDSRDPADFDVDIEALWDFHGIDHARVAARRSISIRANWKLAVENFLECYHCLPNHPELCAVYDHVKMTASLDVARRMEFLKFSGEWMARARAAGTPTRQPRRLNPSDDQFGMAFRMGIKPGFDTLSEDGRPLAPLMGSFSDYDGGETFGFVGPFLHFSLANDHAVLIRIRPNAALSTTIEVSWLVDADAVAGTDYDEKRLRWLWEATVLQDCAMIEQAQEGILSRAFVPGPYTPLETDAQNFKSWYLRLAEAAAKGDR